MEEFILAMKKVNEFVKEVKSEMSKVTWATRKETMTTTLAVFFMVFKKTQRFSPE